MLALQRLNKFQVDELLQNYLVLLSFNLINLKLFKTYFWILLLNNYQILFQIIYIYFIKQIIINL